MKRYSLWFMRLSVLRCIHSTFIYHTQQPPHPIPYRTHKTEYLFENALRIINKIICSLSEWDGGNGVVVEWIRGTCMRVMFYLLFFSSSETGFSFSIPTEQTNFPTVTVSSVPGCLTSTKKKKPTNRTWGKKSSYRRRPWNSSTEQQKNMFFFSWLPYTYIDIVVTHLGIPFLDIR